MPGRQRLYQRIRYQATLARRRALRAWCRRQRDPPHAHPPRTFQTNQLKSFIRGSRRKEAQTLGTLNSQLTNQRLLASAATIVRQALRGLAAATNYSRDYPNTERAFRETPRCPPGPRSTLARTDAAA